MIETLILTLFICLNNGVHHNVKILTILLESIFSLYTEFMKWHYYFSIANVNKVLIGLSGEEKNKLKDILSSQSQYVYFLIGNTELKSESIQYISNSVYYYHLNQEKALEIPIFLYKKFFSTPLFYQNYFSSSKGFYIYLVGKFNNSLPQSIISDLPIGSTILLIGHQSPDQTFPLIYNEIQLSFFQNDCDNIYINFIHTMILSPFAATLVIKTANNILTFDHNNFCPDLTEISLNKLKIKQIESFRDFFRIEIENSLSKNQVVQNFANFIDQRLSNKTAIANIIDELGNSKQYETLMLFNYIASHSQESIEYLLKVSTISINEMVIRNVTALHLAVEHSKLNIIKLLILHGADQNAIDNSNYTPFMIAIKNHKQEVIQYFSNELGICINLTDIEKINDKSLSEKFLDYTCSPILSGSIINSVDEFF